VPTARMVRENCAVVLLPRWLTDLGLTIMGIAALDPVANEGREHALQPGNTRCIWGTGWDCPTGAIAPTVPADHSGPIAQNQNAYQQAGANAAQDLSYCRSVAALPRKPWHGPSVCYPASSRGDNQHP